MPDYELTDIEDYFNSQRAKVRWPFKRLDPLDWSMMDAWQKDGVPFAAICRGIEETITNHVRRQAQGRVNTVRYCEQAIKKHWRDHIAAHVGANPESGVGHQAEFGQERIGEALQAWIAVFKDAVADTSDLQDAFWATIKTLTELHAQYQTIELEALDQALERIEGDLTTALLVEAEAQERLPSYRAEAEKSLASYRERMMPGIFEQTVQNAINKKLREEYDLPRLSLFYL